MIAINLSKIKKKGAMPFKRKSVDEKEGYLLHISCGTVKYTVTLLSGALKLIKCFFLPYCPPVYQGQ